METTTTQKTVYRVLHIEDDGYLLEGFRTCVRDELGAITSGMKIEITPASTIEESMDELQKENPPFDVLIMDLMLARNEADHEEGQRLQADRRKLVRQLFEKGQAGPAGQTDEILKLKERIRVIDDGLKTLIVDDGGIQVVRELFNKKQEKPLERPVIFWTARGLPTIKQDCLSLVHPDWVRIFEKPVREIDVLKAAVDLARKRPGGRP